MHDILVKLRDYKLTSVISAFFIIIALITLLPDAIYAEVKPNSVDAIVSVFQERFNDNSGNSIATFLFERAKVLFWILALIQLGWNLSQLALHGKLEIQGVILAFTRQLLIIGVMYFFLSNAQSHFSAIINSFIEAGQQLAGISNQAGSVSSITALGFKIVLSVFKSLAEIPSDWFGIEKIPIYLVAGICSVIILISFAFASVTFIIAQCKLYMSAMVALYFVGFASCDYTRGIAITAYKSVFCAAIEVFVMFVLFGIASEFFPTIFDDVSFQEDASGFLPVLCQVIVATFIFCGALQTLPQFASGIIMGSPMGGGSAMGSGQALAGAVASGVATGAMMASGAAFGGVGAFAAAKASGAGKLATIGKVMSGMAKGAYGGQQGQMGNIMRAGAQNAILKGMQRNQNSASAPNQNSNNVTP